jgi:hypothetical protein
MANLMGNPVALLLKGYGGSVAGATWEEASARAIMLEEAAKVQILAGVAGKVTRYAAEGLKVSKKNWENKKFVIVGEAGFLRESGSITSFNQFYFYDSLDFRIDASHPLEICLRYILLSKLRY